MSSSDLYKLILEEHRFASEFRLKLFTGWMLVYAALAVGFAWLHTASQPLSYLAAVFAFVMTALMWGADRRHREGLYAFKKVGSNIERDLDNGLKEGQQFFCELESTTERGKSVGRSSRHGTLIDYFAVAALIFFAVACGYLFAIGGKLPQRVEPPSAGSNPQQAAHAGSAR
jgi:hypothetical protein